MARRAANFDHVRELTRKQIELEVAVRALNQQERGKYEELMGNYRDWAAIHAKAPAAAPEPDKPRKPRQRKPEPEVQA